VFVSNSDHGTQQIGGEIMCANMPLMVKQPVIMAIQGELGAGKTQLTKGVARALGVRGNVPSPTYTIVREYRIRTGFLYHIDTWRLNEGKELWDLGLNEMIKPGNVIVIEWLQKVKTEIEQIKEARIIWVDITSVNETKREIKVF
jgi:tRNA threonylcarbamoyladenosine biosynthesis protein TsaE